MKSYKIEKQHLLDRNWEHIFNALDRDPVLIRGMLRAARKEKHIPGSDLDSYVVELSKHVKHYIEFTSSGNVGFF